MMRNPFLIFRDERGTSIIEMALAAPLLATFLIGMVDLSRAYSAKLQVEQAAQRTIEMVQRNRIHRRHGINAADRSAERRRYR